MHQYQFPEQTGNLSNVLHKYNSNLFNFTRKEGVNRDIFDKQMRMEDILLSYFEQIGEQVFEGMPPWFILQLNLIVSFKI